MRVESALLPGDPRPALIEAARGAELLVVGNHGLGGFRGLLLGSTAYGVAGHAACDVVIVRGQPGKPRAEVVVGLDGSAAGNAVLGFAFTEASLRGARLRAVHAWTPFDLGGGFEPVPDDFDDQKGEARLLSEALAGWQERFPEVDVVEEAEKGHAVDVLRAACEGADLLVVGSHGHGELAGMVLGSVSQAMIHHATCPVAVVRIDERHRAR
ncbi:universal stress protein [Nonomuraea sp. NBC_01738]|nr:universal stress protein [Nonomuraea sp. NBC_01738]